MKSQPMAAAAHSAHAESAENDPRYILGMVLYSIAVLLFPNLGWEMAFKFMPDYPIFERQSDFWHFLYRDFYLGIGRGAGLCVSLAAIFYFWNKYPGASRMMLWMTVLSHLAPPLYSLSIYLRTTHLFDLDKHGMPWSTFDLYLNDSIHELISAGTCVLAMSLSLILRPQNPFSRPVPQRVE